MCSSQRNEKRCASSSCLHLGCTQQYEGKDSLLRYFPSISGLCSSSGREIKNCFAILYLYPVCVLPAEEKKWFASFFHVHVRPEFWLCKQELVQVPHFKSIPMLSSSCEKKKKLTCVLSCLHPGCVVLVQKKKWSASLSHVYIRAVLKRVKK